MRRLFLAAAQESRPPINLHWFNTTLTNAPFGPQSVAPAALPVRRQPSLQKRLWFPLHLLLPS